MKQYTELTGLYSLSKTLRFELKPIGKTLEHINRKELITQDNRRADEYEQVKGIIDRFHKDFIKKSLENLKLKLKSDGHNDSLEDYVVIASKTKRTEVEEKELDNVKTRLREQIVDAFENADGFNDLFNKELIRNPPDGVAEDDRCMLGHFSEFTTYFNGFHENRKNMYSDEIKSTAIAHRLIHENLPLFLDNIKSFAKISASEVAENFAGIQKEFENYLKTEHLADFFQLNYFSETLTQERIDLYNALIGGITLENGTNLQGINMFVNRYNQQHKENRLPLLKPLYKMILSDRVSVSWLPEKFTSDKEMLSTINNAINDLEIPLIGTDTDSLKNLLMNIDTYDTEHIYIANDLGLTSISQQIFGQYDVYTNAVKEKLRSEILPKAKEKREPELYEERITKLFKSKKSFSIAYLNSLIVDGMTIQSYYSKLGDCNMNGETRIDYFTQIEKCRIAAEDILAGKHINLIQQEEDIKVIKDLLDSYKSLQHFIKPLLGNGDESDKDNEFDARLRAVWDALDIITPLYDKVRNWLTRKPYSEEKIKLNFENKGNLLDGWVDSKTEKSDNGTQYGGYLFRKKNEIGEYDFYLGISSDTKLFRRDSELQYEEGMFERLDYYQVKGQTIFGSSYVGNYESDSSMLRTACHNMVSDMGMDNSFLPIDDERIPSYLKRIKSIASDESKILLENIRVSDEYSTMRQHILKTLSKLNRVNAAIELSKRSDLSIEELIDAISEIPSKSFGYYPVNSAIMREVNERKDKPLYLFKITNKDLSFAETFTQEFRKRRGTDNLHTMYLKALLSSMQGVYDIGTGEVFFRKQTPGLRESTTVHKANVQIRNKQIINGKVFSNFPYAIIKDRHYTDNKFLFHLSIKVNYDKPSKNVNAEVLELIRANGIKHIIGIDRGERNLLYYSLIDLKGNIMNQNSLNEIGHINYRDMLKEREGDRTQARRNWQKIENIKDLKHGYLSQAVHVIAKMMVEKQAIVVLEDLNKGFIRGRQKIERSVYEQFEKMLFDKLNYYVDKQKDAEEIGGLFHALQLTCNPDSFKKMGTQNGCLFYIPAWNTSKIDPVTGFVNLLDTKYDNVEKARSFFNKFESITYNAEKDWFEFALDYDNFTEKAKGTKTKWTLCSIGTRIRTSPSPQKANQWDNEEINLTEAFKAIFKKADIDIKGELKDSICGLTEKKYLEPLMGLMKLLVQMRNSITDTDIDYIISPVADENGNFYDSRTCSAPPLPKDADANGAYNIARKGLWALLNIKNSMDGESPRLAIRNKEWLQFAQQKPYLND